MMSRLWLTLLLVLSLLALPATANQSSAYSVTFQQEEESSSTVTVDLQGWFVRGDVNWRIGGGGFWYPISELVFPTNGTQPILTFNWTRPDTRYGFRLRLASGGNSGTSTDSDWFLGPASTPSFQTQQPSSGNSRFWGVEANYQLGGEDRTTYSAFLGYSSWTYNFRMTDPVTVTICDPENPFACPPVGEPQTLGLNSTYDINFGGLALGLRGANRVSDQMTLFGSVSFGAIAASGIGFWNLRDLTFKHQGNGSATSLEVGAGWTPRENLTVRLGYNITWLSVTGRETFFCDPDFCGDPGLDWDAKSTNQGVTLAVMYSW